ncbi:hypothetical protein B0T16DRAFT_423328 [Cercophora newfieldiana]|uniref:Uncharacterized protein n=1 Tax=Cercophora newfieldiana TaxID=92897 RepID=A0AA39XSP4_9PEZI|nr:hypothetical protein B0T16DRAFT_423328 [Cercophora newfieldiana]
MPPPPAHGVGVRQVIAAAAPGVDDAIALGVGVDEGEDVGFQGAFRNSGGFLVAVIIVLFSSFLFVPAVGGLGSTALLSLLGLSLEFLFGFPEPLAVVVCVVDVGAGDAEPVAVPGEGFAVVFPSGIGGCGGGAADEVAVVGEVGEGVGLDL